MQKGIVYFISVAYIYHLLLAAFIFINSCNGQVKSNFPKDTKNKPNTIPDNQPKMIKTQGVVSGNVGCQLQDKAGNLWFSTGGEGAYRYDGKVFTNFTTKDGLSDNDVRAIIEDKAGNIVFGTKSGICQYDGKRFTSYSAINTLGILPITCLLEDRDGNLWFGTMGKGIYRYDGKTLTNFLNKAGHAFNLGEHHQLIMDILQDKNGNLWFSSWNGGGVWCYDGKAFKNYLPAADYYTSNEDGRSFPNSKPESYTHYLPTNSHTKSNDRITDDMIFSISEDKKGSLWFATRRHGACRYDGKSFTSFRENEGFVSYGINAIAEDKKGNIWLATDKNGVYCYDGKVFTNFTTNDGLINNSVRSILVDKNGNLWFGTRAFGLCRYDGKTFTIFSEH